jgi:hypothetical protein
MYKVGNIYFIAAVAVIGKFTLIRSVWTRHNARFKTRFCLPRR